MKTLSEIISTLSENKKTAGPHDTFRRALDYFDRTEGRASRQPNTKRRNQYAYGRVESEHGEEAADKLRAFHAEQGENN